MSDHGSALSGVRVEAGVQAALRLADQADVFVERPGLRGRIRDHRRAGRAADEARS